jgi:hypothetical protein
MNPTLPFKEPESLAEHLAEYLQARPNRWINAREFFPIAGSFGWRSRLSECRRAPFNMRIRNRQRRIAPDPTQPDTKITITEYCFEPDRLEEGAADGAGTLPAAV